MTERRWNAPPIEKPGQHPALLLQVSPQAAVSLGPAQR
jgi:hypothetical protein